MSNVSEKDVFQAINELLEEKGKYTNALIQEKIGGSNSTIQKYRKAYEEQNNAELQNNAKKLTKAQSEQLETLVASMLESNLATVLSKSDEASESVKEELEAVLIKNDELVEMANKKQTAIDNYKRDNTELASKLEFLQKEYVQSKDAILKDYESHKKLVDAQLEQKQQQLVVMKQQHEEKVYELKEDKKQLSEKLDKLNEKYTAVFASESSLKTLVEQLQKQLQEIKEVKKTQEVKKEVKP